MEESRYIRKCIALMEEKLGWGDSQDWTNSYFELLSEEIKSNSGILVSATTLKRLFGKAKTYKEVYNPQISTKNALARFLGFANWGEFIKVHCLSQNSVEEPIPEIEQVVDVANAPELPHFVPKRYWLASLGLVLVLIIISSIGTLIYRKISKPSILFTGKYLEGPAPLRPAFYYDVSKLNTRNIYFESNQETHQLDKYGNFFSYSYRIPNFYRAKLVVDDKEVSSLSIHAKSKGWEGLILGYYPSMQVVPKQAIHKKDGILRIEPSQIEHLIVDTTKEFWVDYRNICEYQADADNFTLVTCVKNDTKGSSNACRDVEIEVIAEYNKHWIRMVDPSCSRWARVELAEVKLDGNFTNLSALAQDISNWQKIEMAVKNKQVTLLLAGKPIYKTSYHQSLGKIKGIIIRFKGSGALDFVKLYNQDKKLVYQDEFNG